MADFTRLYFNVVANPILRSSPKQLYPTPINLFLMSLGTESEILIAHINFIFFLYFYILTILYFIFLYFNYSSNIVTEQCS